MYSTTITILLYHSMWKSKPVNQQTNGDKATGKRCNRLSIAAKATKATPQATQDKQQDTQDAQNSKRCRSSDAVI